ncbi:hypothetical protein [Mesorhizobium caraganae]|uniref:hypothetical protein n=1 Tax=Mesorhizobium caraganae TaxID=483206 RepID=UPI003ECF0BD9
MRVYIANFGRENYEWPVCRDRGTVATMNQVEAQALWETGDREAYIVTRMRGKTAAGLPPTRAVAARWYNLMTIVSGTSNDLWLHKEGDRLWWTISKNAPPSFERKIEPVGDKRDVILCHKPCEPWSYLSRTGQELFWRSLHPKAKDFLSTEATLQELSEDYASYALALIEGSDLSPWHSLPLWRTKNENAKTQHNPVTSYDGKRIAAYREAAERMGQTVLKTVKTANGQTVLRFLKDKQFLFNDQASLERHIIDLINRQEGLCALTDLPLDFDERGGDKAFYCSLDRIDSAGHYELDNLQIVCRFANFWKAASDDSEFRRLIKEVRSVRSPTNEAATIAP